MRRVSACAALVAALCLSAGASAAPRFGSSLVVDLPTSSRVAARAPVESARDILFRAAGSPARVQLVSQRVSTIGASRVYRFDQRYKGLDVVGRGGALVTDPAGKPRFGTLRVENRLPDSIVPSVQPDLAASIAAKRAGLSATAANARLVIWPAPDGGHLAWSVLPPSLLPLPYVPLVIVDASSGAVLSFQNLVRNKNLANTFEFNPVKTPDEIEVTLPVDDPLTVPENALVKSFNCVDTHETKSITYMGFPFTVHVCAMLQSAVADTDTGDFTQYAFESDTAPEDPFSEISIYYHTNKAYEFFKTFDPSFELQGNSKPLFVVANLMVPAGLMSGDLSKISDVNTPFDPFPNAFSSGWDPVYGPLMSTLWPEITGAALMFGQGEKIDFAYDGDVVYHEFSHSVVGSTLKLAGSWHLDSQGASAAPGAMNEGLADYFSSAITGDPDSGEYAGTEFGDDAIRHLDNDYTCPQHLAGEVHFDSQFWSAALWATRAGLPSDAERHQFDEALFTAMSSGPTGDLGYEEVADLFVTAVESSPLGSAVAQQLTTAFQEHGALPECTRTIEWTGKTISSKEPALGYHFIAGGLSGFVVNMPFAPGVFQVHVPLTGTGNKLQVAFSNLVAGGGGSPIPTGNTPYKPAFLVNFNEPIAFDLSGTVKANTDLVVDATKSNAKYSADIDIPDGATEAWVMVVNKGEDDGYYTQITFKTLSDEPQPDAGVEDSGGDQPDAAVADAPDEAATTPPDPTGNAAAPSDDSGGCGCRLPSSREQGSAGLALLAALAGSVVARRRKAGRMSS